MRSALNKLYHWRYPLAIVMTGLTYLARPALQPILGELGGGVLFTVAITFSALNGGFGPGLLATALSMILTAFAIFEPHGLIALAETASLLTLGLFALVGVSISAMSGALHNIGRRREGESGAPSHVISVIQDISDRKRAEDALRTSEERYRLTFEQAAVGISHVGLDGRWLRVNQKVCEITGYTAEEMMALAAQDLTHPDDLRLNMDLRAQLMAGEITTFSMEKRYIRKDRELVWVNLTASLHCDASGAPNHFISVIQDISDRKRAEDALRQAHAELERRVEERTAELAQAVASLTKTEALLRHAVDVADIGIFERDHVADEVYYSPTLRKIVDLPEDRQDRLGDFLSRIHTDDREIVNRARRRAHDPAGDGRLLYECRVVRRDGSVGWILNRAQTFFDGTGDARKPSRTIGAVLDITERMRSEEALRASEERLKHALAVGHMGTWERDLRSGEMAWDDRDFEIFGIAKDRAISRDLFLAHVHPADLPVMEEAISKSERDGQDYACEFRLLRPDGKMIWLSAHGGLRRDANGVATHLAGINYDITERKTAEETLRNLNEQLDRRVAQRTQELAESRARLRALVAEVTMTEERERRRLAVDLHDTLAQSLAVVNLYLWRVRELLGDQAHGISFKEVLGNLDTTVDDSIKYTRSLIAELSPPVLYDLGLPAAFRWLGEQMSRHGLRVEVDGPADGFSLAQDDAVFLFQCARELLWNVVKHGFTDRATVVYGRDRNRVSLAVTDNGIGFDAQTVRANGDGRSHFGLFSIHERVELRGGAVEINSTPGAGSRVLIVLPMDRTAGTSVNSGEPILVPSATAPVIEQAIKILIVDDHKMLRQGLRRVLEEQGGFTVVGEASDGAEALALARVLEPQVVIMDVNMPNMNGIEATEKIIHDRPSTIVIGISFGTEDYVVRAMQAAGAVTCLPKERAVEDVSQAIMDAVAARRQIKHA
jgi:PAS domain S-box-containing protein